VSELPFGDLGAYPSAQMHSNATTTSSVTPAAATGDSRATTAPRLLKPVAGRRASVTVQPAAAAAGRRRYHDDDMLTVAEAARVARRCIRTLRRAYLSGRMVAHRDGNGRGVTIRYGDLRAWLMAEQIARAPMAKAVSPAIARVNVRARDSISRTGNAELLEAALKRRGERRRTSRPRPASSPQPADRASADDSRSR
jgi:hypothetical protein